MRIASSLYILGIVALTFAIHEAAHGLSTSALGYEAFVRVNSSGLVSGAFRSALHDDITSAAGPLITVLQGLTGALLVALWHWRPAFVLVAAALMMRVLAALASLRLPNDEARLGLSWGMGYWTVHIATIAVLLGLTIWAARRSALRRIDILRTLAVITVSMIVVVASEPYLPTAYLPAL